MATRQENKGACGCCGGECLCTCCDPHYTGTGRGIWTQWDLVLGGGSPIRLTKVAGLCVWKSADGLYRVKRGIGGAGGGFGGTPTFYAVGIYSSAGDADSSPAESSTIEVAGAFDPPFNFSWCRPSSNADPIQADVSEDPYLPTYGYDWSITPVSGTWLVCDDNAPGVADGTEPPHANWTECD